MEHHHYEALRQDIHEIKSAIIGNEITQDGGLVGRVNKLEVKTDNQLSWNVFGISRNDTSGANSYVQLYDRKAKRIQEMNVSIPYSVLSVWLEDKIIDDYILTFLGLKKR